MTSPCFGQIRLTLEEIEKGKFLNRSLMQIHSDLGYVHPDKTNELLFREHCTRSSQILPIHRRHKRAQYRTLRFVPNFSHIDAGVHHNITLAHGRRHLLHSTNVS